MATRITAEVAKDVLAAVPDARYLEVARIVVVGPQPAPTRGRGTIAVLSAGTADIPIAEEAATTAELDGNQVVRIFDVGVAGLHRLLAHREAIEKAEVLVAVAGMDGVLPTVVGGLFSRPVIAVPTSIGYGAAFGGMGALLTMLNSCATGVAVVNSTMALALAAWPRCSIGCVRHDNIHRQRGCIYISIPAREWQAT